MGISYKITMDMGAKMDLVAGINAKVMPMLNQAVRAIAQQAVIDWKEAVYKAKLWQGEKDAYASSIKYEMTGDFSAWVSTDYKHADEIESGRPQRDLKKMLDTSLKVRRTEGGKRFLVIPMRHNTPGNNALARAMPQGVYDMAKEMTPSRVLSTGQRPSGQVTHLSPKLGMHASPNQTPYLSNPKTKSATTVASRQYAWGQRLTAAALKGAGFDKAEAKKYAGMVKMDTSTPGGSTSSSYMTFRIMMEGSKGWIVPAQPGQYIAKKVAEQLQPKADKAFAAAVAKTMKG